LHYISGTQKKFNPFNILTSLGGKLHAHEFFALPEKEETMFWRKVLHILVISILLVGGIVSPSTAKSNKLILKSLTGKHLATTYTVCASGCDFSGIQTAIDSVGAGDTLNLAGETFTESITIDKDLTIQGAGLESTIVQAATAPGIATSRVVTTLENISVIIRDLTIRHGYYQSPVGTSAGGAGIYNKGDLEIENCTISDNETNAQGGGMYNDSSGNLILENVIFTNNSAYYGGGVYNNSSDPELMDVTFTNNTVFGHGGGFYNNGGAPLLTGVIFVSNLSDLSGGGMSNSNGNPVLIDVLFSDNSTEYSEGGGMFNGSSSPVLTNVTFLRNSANSSGGNGSGGGMYNRNSTPVLTSVTFSSNSAYYYGAGMANDGSNPTLTNVIFTKNSGLGVAGGGMSNELYSYPILKNVIFSNNNAQIGGGIFNDSESDPILANVSFFENSASSQGGGIYNTGNSNPSLTNVIMWGNTSDYGSNQIHNDFSSTPVISYTLIQDSGGSGAGWDSSLGSDGGGNIDADPFFVDPLNNDLHLGAGSPAIDAGDDSNCPATDLDGILRPQGAGCDMGAYEYAPLVLQMNVDTLTPEPEEIITFTIQVTNNLTETITGGLITDTLHTDLNFLEAITLEPPMSGTLTFEFPKLVTNVTIGPGKGITVTFPVAVSFGLAGGTTITNTAWVTSTEVLTPALGSAVITIANAPPVGVDDEGGGYSTDEDTAFTTANVLLNDTDPNEDTLAVSELITTTTLGLIIDNGDGTFEYDPHGQFDSLTLGEQATDTFTYTVSDGELTDTAIVTITITGVNDPPMVDAGVDQTMDEGELVQFEGSFSDPDSTNPDIHWDFGDGYAVTDTLTPTHTYLDDGVYTVTLTVTDTFGTADSDWLFVTVENVAPTLSAFSDFEITAGETITIPGTITDPGVLDSQTVFISWETGATETIELGAAERQFSASYTYTDAGVYPVTVRVTDKDGDWNEQNFTITVDSSDYWVFLPIVKR